MRLKWHSKGQSKAFNCKSRFVVIIAGRRWGKTRGSANWLIWEGLKSNGIPVAWIAPVYRQAKIAFRYLKLVLRHNNVCVKINSSDLEIELINGTVIQFRSADSAENIEGEGYKAIVLDECWNILNRDKIWYNSIRPTLSDHQGRCVFISRADFDDSLLYNFYLKGLDENVADWEAFKFLSSDNPMITDSEIETLKGEMPTTVFLQQIMAEFLSSEGRAVPNIDLCAIAQLEDFYKQAYAPYVMGLDLAKSEDYTVITIGRQGRVIFYKRFNKLSWPIQEKIIYDIAQKYDAKVIIDSTGVGDPVYDHLLLAGLDVEPYQFTEASRKQLLELLILTMDQEQLTFPNEEIIKAELKSMRWERTKSGKMKLMVPEGRHDDTVMSLALCNWGMTGPMMSHITEDDIHVGEELQTTRDISDG